MVVALLAVVKLVMMRIRPMAVMVKAMIPILLLPA